MITNKNSNVDLANLPDKEHCKKLQKKLTLMNKLYVIKHETTRDKSLISLPKSPAKLVSGVSTNVLPENPN